MEQEYWRVDVDECEGAPGRYMYRAYACLADGTAPARLHGAARRVPSSPAPPAHKDAK